ncbi:MAG: PepSY domain-containing protein [Phycisphaerae bacterium]
MLRCVMQFVVIATCALPALAADDEEYFAVLGHDIAKFAAAHAKVDALRAIDVARESAREPVFEMVELVMDGPTPIYEVLFLGPDGPSEVELDAVTGKLLPIPPEPVPADKREAALRKRAQLSGAKVDLRRAIELSASEIKGGTVVRAKAEHVDAEVAYAVEVLIDGVFKLVTLAADGQVKRVGSSPEEPGGRAWTFDREPAGKPPAGWSAAFTNGQEGKAQWLVTADPKPMTGPKALKLNAESGVRTYNLCLVKDTALEDVDVRARIRADGGKEDQGGGLVWRCKDADNYYICRINPLEGNFRVYHVIAGQRQQLQSVDVRTEPGKWYAIRAKMLGDHILCFLDGKKLLDMRDDSIKGAGMIGLWTKADASSSFDNVAVRKASAYPTDADPVALPSSNPASRPVHHDDDDD